MIVRKPPGREETRRRKRLAEAKSKQGYYTTSAGNTEGENKPMERVNEIRADIAANASHITNKMLLQDLRAISQLFTTHCSDGLSDEEFYRFSIIKNAINTKNTDSLRRIEVIVSRSLGGLRQRKTSGGDL